MYDAIVIGARCAGSPAAMLLARKGYRVLLVDRAAFPSDTLSSHYVQLSGAARLARWGLLDRVGATNCPPIGAFTFDLGPVVLAGAPPPLEGVREGYCARRRALDKVLVDAAAEAGAEVRETFSVQELLEEDGAVVGIRGRDAGGASVAERARVVIGADGMNSFVAKAVGAEEYQEVPARTCTYYTYFADVPCGSVELYTRDGLFCAMLATNDGLTIATVLWPRAEFPRVRADVEGEFMRGLEAISPGLGARVRAGRRAERFAGTADTRNFFRRPWGRGWALAGDAGYHRDAITAQGISDAFRDADLLADALDAGFSGRRPLEEALADFARERDEDSGPMYGLTCDLAALKPPPPEMRQLFAALAGNPAETERFFGSITGSVPVQEFWAPSNLGRIVAAAAGS